MRFCAGWAATAFSVVHRMEARWERLDVNFVRSQSVVRSDGRQGSTRRLSASGSSASRAAPPAAWRSSPPCGALRPWSVAWPLGSPTGLVLKIEIAERLPGLVRTMRLLRVRLDRRAKRRETARGGHGAMIGGSAAERASARAQSTTCGYLLYRCVRRSGQRRERRRAHAALGYTRSALHPPGC